MDNTTAKATWIDKLTDEQRRILLTPMNIDKAMIRKAQMLSAGYRVKTRKMQR